MSHELLGTGIVDFDDVEGPVVRRAAPVSVSCSVHSLLEYRKAARLPGTHPGTDVASQGLGSQHPARALVVWGWAPSPASSAVPVDVNFELSSRRR